MPEEEKITKDIRNLFRMKDIRNFFRLEKETRAIKDRILGDIKNIFEHEEEENHCKLVRENNVWSNFYIEYENNGDSKNTTVEEYLNKITPCLKDIYVISTNLANGKLI